MITLPNANLLVSFVLATHNRRDEVLNTLKQIGQCGLARDAYEILVVDNSSTDGTADAIASSFPQVMLLRESKNRGSCAKNIALRFTRGRFVVFLDDDSYPERGAVQMMIRYFERDPKLGAAVFRVHLPDGAEECSAYPNVFIGAGTGFRRRALSDVGGLCEDFFMQAEEYDLSLRLLDAGWKVQRFDDLHVEHLKSPTARRSDRVMRLDVRNNFVIANRYFADEWAKEFSIDWLRRYFMLAKLKKQRRAFFAGCIQGVFASASLSNRRQISDRAFETFAQVRSIENRLRMAKEFLDLRTVLFVDMGKNILPFFRAAQVLGIDVVAIADNTFAQVKRAAYRGIPIISDDDARSLTFDAAVISNLSPVHVAQRRSAWRKHERFRPVVDLFERGRPWDFSAIGDSVAGQLVNGEAESALPRIVAQSA